jgi:hypothetical protein
MAGIDRRGFLAGLGAAAVGVRAAAQGAPRRVEIRPDSRHVVEGGREHHFAETVFEVPSDYSGQSIGLEIGPQARIDVLRIRLKPGARNINRFLQIGPGARIGLLDVEAAEQTDRHDEKLDGFVQIRADDITIEAMRFTRIDRCLMIQDAARIRIGSFDCTSYSKGVRINRSEDVTIGQLTARTTSPNAIRGKPGENGLTISDSRRLAFPEVVIEDAAEHAVYLAGGSGERFSEDVRFGRVVSRRAAQCGFKCKAPQTASRGVSIDRLEVTDSAFRSRPGRNEDALRVENAHGFRIGWLEARCVESRASCYAGVYLDGVRDFALAGGVVECPRGPMVMIEDRRGFDNAGITIARLDGQRLRLHGYLIHHTERRALSSLTVDGGLIDGVGGDAVHLAGNGQLAGDNRIRIAARGVGGALIAGDAAGIDVQVVDLS